MKILILALFLAVPLWAENTTLVDAPTPATLNTATWTTNYFSLNTPPKSLTTYFDYSNYNWSNRCQLCRSRYYQMSLGQIQSPRRYHGWSVSFHYSRRICAACLIK